MLTKITPCSCIDDVCRWDNTKNSCATSLPSSFMTSIFGADPFFIVKIVYQRRRASSLLKSPHGWGRTLAIFFETKQMFKLLKINVWQRSRVYLRSVQSRKTFWKRSRQTSSSARSETDMLTVRILMMYCERFYYLHGYVMNTNMNRTLYSLREF